MKLPGGGAEGSLLIRVQRKDGRAGTVSIQSSRPLNMPLVFSAKQPEQVLSTLPLLYSVCGRAQGCAAVEAIEQATGVRPPFALWSARRLLVWFETAREHLWRISLDWPEFLGEEPAREPIRQIADLMRAFQQALFQEQPPFALATELQRPDLTKLQSLVDALEGLLQTAVFTRKPAHWLRLRSEQDLSDWMAAQESVAARMPYRVKQQGLAGLGRSQVQPLPELGPLELNQRLVSPEATGFIARPTWQGDVAETSPFSRQVRHPLVQSLIGEYGNGLLPRLITRLVELAMIPERLTAGVRGLAQGTGEGQATRTQLPTGIGIAQVEASRGRLVHRVDLEHGRVNRYQILAPTEWNFHPKGVLTAGLAGLYAKDADEFHWQTRLLINAIDPCVGYDLEVV